MSDKTANNVNFYGNVTGVQIQQGNNNYMQVIDNISSNEEKLQMFLNQLQQYKTQFPEVFGEKIDTLVEAKIFEFNYQ